MIIINYLTFHLGIHKINEKNTSLNELWNLIQGRTEKVLGTTKKEMTIEKKKKKIEFFEVLKTNPRNVTTFYYFWSSRELIDSIITMNKVVWRYKMSVYLPNLLLPLAGGKTKSLFKWSIHIYRPLRLGRIWHKVSFF